MAEKVIALLLALTLLPSTVATATAMQATPGPDERALPEGVTADRLIVATLNQLDLPGAVDILALARVTLLPGAEATARNGAHLFVVESGALTVQEFLRTYPPPGTPGPVHENVPAGPPVTHGAGDQFLVSYDVASPPAITNEGAESAVALVVSIAQTGTIHIDGSLLGWSVVKPLVVEDAARVGSFLIEAGLLGAEPISVSLVRASYEQGAGRGPGGELIDEAMIDIGGFIVESGSRLLAVESGALNYIVIDPALHRRPDATPNQVPAMSRLSQIPGDQLLVLAPGRMLTRNVERGPSTVLIVTVGSASLATVQS